MKTLFCIIIALLTNLFVQAQLEIKIEDLSTHINDSVKVCTKIYGGIYLDRSTDTPTLLNAGDAYPHSPLTLVIWAEARKKFKEAPEIYYKNKEVCITGKLILYKNKPEIVIYDENQIVLQKIEDD